MQRSALALCALLAVCVAAQAQICAPPAGSLNFTLTATDVIESGYLSIDFRQNALAANVTGWNSDGEMIQGNFIYVNNTGYWIADGECGQTPNTPIPAILLNRCLPAGGLTTPLNVAGQEGVNYLISTDMNVTSVTIIPLGSFNIPVSHSFFSFAQGVESGLSFSLLYSNPTPTTDNSYFMLPSICMAAKPMPPKAMSVAHRMMHTLRLF